MTDLQDLVENIDDLGSEVIINLGSLAAYRYPQQLFYLHCYLMQMTQ